MASASSSSGWQDPERPLPQALQQLLAELGTANTLPQRTLFDVDLSDDQYGPFFKYDSPSSPQPMVSADDQLWWDQVRLEVLRAIGKCQTLKTIQFRQWYYTGCHSREEELEALWGGLASISHISALQELDLSDGPSLGREVGYMALGGLLRRSPTLLILNVTNTGMEAEGLGHLVSSLQANPHNILRHLGLSRNKVGSSGAAGGAHHVVKLLQHTVCPSLQTLCIEGIGLDLIGAEMIGRALAGSTTLKELKVGDDACRAAGLLLQTGLGGSGRGSMGIRSILKLEVRAMPKKIVPYINELLCTNSVLEEYKFVWSRWGSATAGLQLDKAIRVKKITLGGQYSAFFNRAFFESLRGNQTLETLDLRDHKTLDHEGFLDGKGPFEILIKSCIHAKYTNGRYNMGQRGKNCITADSFATK